MEWRAGRVRGEVRVCEKLEEESAGGGDSLEMWAQAVGGGRQVSTARGGSGGAGRVTSVILVKHSGKTINVDNNYALAA